MILPAGNLFCFSHLPDQKVRFFSARVGFRPKSRFPNRHVQTSHRRPANCFSWSQPASHVRLEMSVCRAFLRILLSNKKSQFSTQTTADCPVLAVNNNFHHDMVSSDKSTSRTHITSSHIIRPPQLQDNQGLRPMEAVGKGPGRRQTPHSPARSTLISILEDYP